MLLLQTEKQAGVDAGGLLAQPLNLRAALGSHDPRQHLLVQLALHLLLGQGAVDVFPPLTHKLLRNVRDDSTLRAAWKKGHERKKGLGAEPRQEDTPSPANAGY